MLKLNVEKMMSSKVIEKTVADETQSKSSRMVSLFTGGLDVKEISILMNVRYNFVYNVVTNYLRKEGIEDSVVRERKTGVKDSVITLIKEGKTNVEISKELKANYNMIWKIRKDFEIEENSKK